MEFPNDNLNVKSQWPHLTKLSLTEAVASFQVRKSAIRQITVDIKYLLSSVLYRMSNRISGYLLGNGQKERNC